MFNIYYAIAEHGLINYWLSCTGITDNLIHYHITIWLTLYITE